MALFISARRPPSEDIVTHLVVRLFPSTRIESLAIRFFVGRTNLDLGT